MQLIRIPGTFVVLQGVPGDGFCNTMDSLPSLVFGELDDSEEHDENTLPRGDSHPHDEAVITTSTWNAATQQQHTTTPTSMRAVASLASRLSPILCAGMYPSSAISTPVVIPPMSASSFMAGAVPIVSPASLSLLPTTLSLLPNASITTTTNTTTHPGITPDSQQQQMCMLSNCASSPPVAVVDNTNDAFVVVSDGSFRSSVDSDEHQGAQIIEDACDNSNNPSLTHQLPNTQDDDNNKAVMVAPSTRQGEDQNSINESFCPKSADQPMDEVRELFNETQGQALEEWKAECRENELFHRREWYEASVSLNNSDNDDDGEDIRNYDEHCQSNNSNRSSSNTFDGATVTTPWWMTDDGCLAIFDGLPLHVFGVAVGYPRAPVGKLTPGTVVVATELVTLSSKDLVTRVDVSSFSYNADDADDDDDCSKNDEINEEKGFTDSKYYPHGRPGWVQLLKIESPVHGYCVLSVNGYSYLGPGLPGGYCDCEDWYWRITCIEGAFVRKGLDLSSDQLATIPYGSLVRVKQKTINAMALSRLQIEAAVYNDGDGSQDFIEGWISEFLNPLSGQRGPIALPVPFPVPALYEVTLPNGAVIRSDVELSSPIIGHAPKGALLTVTGRVYSENPKDKCIARYRLAGNGGWISARLNMAPPDDEDVVRFVGTASTFEPDKAGLFHLAAMRSIQSQQQQQQQQQQQRVVRPSPSRTVSMISSIGDDADDSDSSSSSNIVVDDSADERLLLVPASSEKTPSCTYSAPSAGWHRRRSGPAAAADDRCLICLCEDRTATMVHGETGHVACCLVCARILKARGDPCPVCRLPIDLVVQHFWA